jgi:protein TonB
LPGAEPTPAAPDRPNTAANPGEQLLSASTGRRTRLQMLPMPDPATAESSEALERLAEPPPASDRNLRLRGQPRDELYVTADTRASRLAPYLNDWRQKVERIGTLNYPSVAQRRGLSGNPVIEVALQRDGKLKSARIQRSSGYPEIDAAALGILRLASPFDPFPPQLAREYLTIRFVYEWSFEGSGGGAPGVLTLP